MDLSFIISAFFAGLLMFLAPCTLPLVPGYLAFISGADQDGIREAQRNDARMRELRRRVFHNGVFYVLGFSAVFILFGTLAGFVGASILGQYRILLTKVGGVFVIFFGLFMLDIIRINGLNGETKLKLPAAFQKGKPSTSFLLGGAFALGWTPCIGPILASVLLLASTSTTALDGAFLLAVFSLGLGLPFLAVAWGIGSAYSRVSKITKYMPIISKVGGIFLIILGILLYMNNLGLLISYGYSWFGFLGYDRLLDFY